MRQFNEDTLTAAVVERFSRAIAASVSVSSVNCRMGPPRRMQTASVLSNRP